MRAGLATLLVLILFDATLLPAGPYVTESSAIRWNDVGGIRWKDVGGIRWNDVGGIRWNDVGGIRWNDVGATLFNDASGIRWNDVGGIRWNDVGGLSFEDALATGGISLDLELLDKLSFLPDTSSINVIVTYRAYPGAADLAALNGLGIPGGTIFRRLPMVVVNATPDQLRAIAHLPAVRSVYADRTLSFFDQESRALIGLPEVETDPELALVPAGAPTGAGVTIAVLDTGVDATHPDLPFGSKVVQNVRVNAALNTGPGFIPPVPVEGIPNTDLLLGHGTFVASVAAGSGAASAGAQRGAAPGASILGLSAGDLFITNVLEGFDYILDNAARFGVRVVNCSWGTEGFFDPDDPVNIATRALYDAGITVVFAVGNHGPAADTLNPYSVAPWVIGVGSVRKDGRLSDFSSRGIFEELLYHPVLLAPGESITAASPVLLNGGSPYSTASGTSFAAPHVAGVVALLLQANPALTPAEVKRLVQRTATPFLGRDRSEVGAGRLDAWAALTQARQPARPFGTHIPGWLDARPYRIEHRPAVLSQATLPAGGTLQVPVSVEESALSWQLSLAWGTAPGLSDLDLQVADASGRVVGRSTAINGLALFGREDGVHVLGAVPPAMTATISFKTGTGPLDQPFSARQETSVAALTAYSDVAALDPASLRLITRAVSQHVLVGRADHFVPGDGLTRAELARALALTAGLPQRIPSGASFPDVGVQDAAFPYIETVAGTRAKQILMGAAIGKAFKPRDSVTRLDFTVALVRAAGLEAAAQARAGEALAVVDASSIPYSLRGYIAVGLENNLIAVVPAAGGSAFNPAGALVRLDAARFLLNLLDRRGGL
ncbi:MAG TPA: S8 family serine peptidase [Candidatus Cryosericum sp.]|nr:S8 family serine peptidase [Candidatus Cryosericum sp.]